MRTLVLTLAGVAALGATFWLGTQYAPARYQLLEHNRVVVRLDQSTGEMTPFVMTQDPQTKRVLFVTPETYAAQERTAREIRDGLEAQTRIRLAPCLAKGKALWECEYDEMVRAARR